MASVQKQAIISHERKLDEQVNAEKQAKIALLEANKRLWSMFKKLGPEKIPARFHYFLEDKSAFGSEVDASSN